MLAHRWRTGFIVAVMAIAMAGCAATDPDESPRPPATDDGLLCGGVALSRAALESRVPVGELDDSARTALAAATWDDGSPVEAPPEEGWYLAVATDDVVAVMRDVEVVVDPVSPGMPPDREMRMVEWVAEATNLTPGWYGSMRGPCALTVDLGDLTVPAIELQEPPDPLDQELQLLVTEQSCNGGEDAEGRVEVVRVEETDDRVSILLGVRPRGGMHTCPGHPATPFTLSLSEPLGEREVVDAGLADPRAVPVHEKSPLAE